MAAPVILWLLSQAMNEPTEDAVTRLVREDVQSYPRPPALEPVPLRIIVRYAGVLVADTINALRVLETHHAPSYYLPHAAVLAGLQVAAGSSFCEWKGHARYFDMIAGDSIVPHAAWSYDRRTARFARLASDITFCAGLIDEAWMGDTRAILQSGDIYGG